MPSSRAQCVAHDEVALRAAPRARPGRPRTDARQRRRAARCSPGAPAAVVNSRSTTTSASREARLDVAMAELDALGDVGRLARACGSTPSVNMSSCRIGASGFIASSTSMTCGSTSYSTLISFSASLGDGGAGGGDGGDGMAVVERLLARHARCARRRCSSIIISPAGMNSDGWSREVVAGDDRLHAGQRLGLRGVDRPDARVRRAGCAARVPTSWPGRLKSAP